MNFLHDRRTVLALIGGALALLAGLGVALILVAKSRGEKASPPPASTAGLVVEAGSADEGHLDPARPLRCFVGGQLVGELTLAQCARRNGVATGSLDVGVDESGNLAAADQAGALLTPLPPPRAVVTAPLAASTPTTAPAAASAVSTAISPAGPCWRYVGAEWRRLPGELTLNACVQSLFAGRCERFGGALYGRWMQQALRLVPGKVEVSGDDRSFRTLVKQGAACSIPAIG